MSNFLNFAFSAFRDTAEEYISSETKIYLFITYAMPFFHGLITFVPLFDLATLKHAINVTCEYEHLIEIQ